MVAAAKAWDEVRAVFATSIMIDTSLNSLAQNLDGPEWPIKGKDETPASYVDLNYEEMIEMLQLKGQKPELAERLTAILKDTIAFDSPYGEMIEQAQAASEKDNQLLKNLTKLAIPENFPIALTSLEAGTLEFCKLEKLSTLGEFAVFAQSMSQAVIVGGDFRKLLNALSHVDEATLAAALPFRPGQKGLHLAEAIGHAARSPDGAARAELATTWFHEEIAMIEKDLAAGGSLDRHFVVLGNPELEKQAMALLRPHLRLPRREVEKKKAGWFSRLFKGK
jgi:hypothetical protein